VSLREVTNNAEYDRCDIKNSKLLTHVIF